MYGQSAGLIFIKGISFKRITEKRKKTSKKSLERIKKEITFAPAFEFSAGHNGAQKTEVKKREGTSACLFSSLKKM
jgi:hypothetical protein